MFNISEGDQFVTLAEAATILGLTVSAVDDLVAANEIRSLTLIHKPTILSRLPVGGGSGE